MMERKRHLLIPKLYVYRFNEDDEVPEQYASLHEETLG